MAYANPTNKREYMRVYRKENSEKFRAYDRKRRSGSVEAKLKYLLSLAKCRAKRRGIDFSITIEDIPAVTHCPIWGVKLNYASIGGHSANSPSIDRIDPQRGYVPGNVWIVSRRANTIKNNASLAELEQLVFALRKMHAA